MSTSNSLCDDCGQATKSLHTFFSPQPATPKSQHLYSAVPASSLQRQANQHYQPHQQPKHHNQHHHHHHQQQQQHTINQHHLHTQYTNINTTTINNNNNNNKISQNHHQGSVNVNQQQQHNMAAQHYKFHNDCQSSVLTYEQVKRLDFVMDQTVPIHGRGNFPTLYVKLKELIRLVKFKLQKEHSIEVRDVRLNGGAASYVLAPENSHYNDLDLIFATDLSDQDRFDVIRDVVLECLKEFFPNKEDEQQCRQLKEAHFIHNHIPTNKNDNTTISQQHAITTSNTMIAHENVEKTTVNDAILIDDNKENDVAISPSSLPNLQDDGAFQVARQARLMPCDFNNITIKTTPKTGFCDADQEATTEALLLDDDSKILKTTRQQQQYINIIDDTTKKSERDNKGKVAELLVKKELNKADTKLGENSTRCQVHLNDEDYSLPEMEVNDEEDSRKKDVQMRKIDAGAVQVQASNLMSNPYDLQQQLQYHNYQQSFQMPLTNCAIKEAYVHKMVKVNDDDRWSLISLGVQQSEGNCCGQTNNLLSSSSQQLQQYRNSLEVSSANDKQPQVLHGYKNNNISESDSSASFKCHSLAATKTLHNEAKSTIDLPNSEHSIHNHHHHHHQHIQNDPNYSHQHQQQFQSQRSHYQQQKQFPNSIELKFVDRMRRKFEFSVDSFQIILDSLIQFYDYAPQSTVASQRKLISSHPSSTMVNTRPLISKQRYVYSNNESRAVVLSDGESTSKEQKTSSLSMEYRGNNSNHHQYKTSHSSQNLQAKDSILSETKPCDSVLNSFQNYYQLSSGDSTTNDSPSVSSVASSSGCSSSSSVVSSSSLSCDEDQEDLYCDNDGPSSSSASTSSLLSSTNSSLLSSTDVACSVIDLEPQNSNQCQLVTSSSQQEQQRLPDYSHSNKLDKLQLQLQKRIGLDESNSNLELELSSKQIMPAVNSQEANIKPFYADCMDDSEKLQHQTQQTFNNGRSYDFESSYQTSTCAVISENFYPTVIARSEYGNFKEAFYHLERKLIATRSPEEIRGGGLLKYCNLLVKNYKPTNVYQIRTLERYMCSRFFIDFSDLCQQQAKLESYLANHFSDDPILKFDYLTILHNVVHRSTVCLMNHELRLTLNMIRDLAYRQNGQQNQQQQTHLQNQAHQQQLVASHQLQQHQSQAHLQPQLQQLNQSQTQLQQHQHYYQQQKPVLFQSGVYRVELVNYTLAKPVRPQ